MTKRSTRNRAVTLVEVLVVLAVIAVLAPITHAVLSRARASAEEVTCLTRFSSISNAIGLYRANWGNESADVGTAPFLGLPHSPWKMLYTLSVNEDERYEMLSCPLYSRQSGIQTGYNWTAKGWVDVGLGNITFLQATEALRGETPLLICNYHNPANIPFEDRGVTRTFIYLMLNSNTRTERLKGIKVSPPPSAIDLRDWVLVKSNQ
jgi:prepilin-type N-terminal cleavage/methylation domain-containing protein